MKLASEHLNAIVEVIEALDNLVTNSESHVSEGEPVIFTIHGLNGEPLEVTISYDAKNLGHHLVTES